MTNGKVPIVKRVLCYGDSNTWGYDPANNDPVTGKSARYDEHTRWAGVMRDLLGQDYFVWEAGLSGRTTVFDDPVMPTRNGVRDFEMVLQMCDPVDCVIIALGSNDMKDQFQVSSLIAAKAMDRFLNVCKAALQQSRFQQAEIILVCPLIPYADGNGVYGHGFSDRSTQEATQLRKRYQALAQAHHCAFVDWNDYVSPSPADGIHMTPEGHKCIGEMMTQLVRTVLND